MIFRICNWPIHAITDGGSSRDLALIEFTESVNGTVEYIQNDFFYHSKFHRLLRVIQLLGQVLCSPHKIVLLYYPGYPFFWKHKVTIWFFISLIFSLSLFLLTRIQGKRIVVDVVDLPLYQYRDLHLPMEMSEKTFHFFDQVVFTLADEVWFASGAFAALAQREYRLASRKVKTVLNGAFRLEPAPVDLESSRGSDVFRFVYAGTMNAARELDAMLRAFVSLPYTHIELHLCGIEGEWIPVQYPDPRIIFHGHLDQAEALGLLHQCDIGIIPYPERGYYNMVFPSKFSLYMIGGVMFLGSDATEVAQSIDQWKVGIHGPIATLDKLMIRCVEKPDLVQRCKAAAANQRMLFYWDAIYQKVLENALVNLVEEL
jgi:hypothetical protein